MKIIQKILKTEGKDYYIKHLNIINPFLPVNISEKEIEVLSSFMSLDEKIVGTDMFNTYARKLAKESLNMSSGSLSNHLKTLLEKGFIKKDEESNRLYIVSYLFPEEKIQGYQFKIVKE